jgi:hypothetical protein
MQVSSMPRITVRIYDAMIAAWLLLTYTCLVFF